MKKDGGRGFGASPAVFLRWDGALGVVDGNGAWWGAGGGVGTGTGANRERIRFGWYAQHGAKGAEICGSGCYAGYC